jgi:hypothetical protein
MLGDNSASYEVRQGKLKRDHLDNTHNSHGYMCQPISTAGLHGWEFVLKNDVKFIWDGTSSPSREHVQILEGGVTINGDIFVDTGTANATISFQLNCIIETDPDHYVWLTGAPNYFIDGVQPMDALLQSDWYHFNSIQFCWKITKANEEITIPAGTPFMFMMNYPKNLLETTNFSEQYASEEDLGRVAAYGEKRDSFYKNSEAWKWHQMYKHGIESDDIKHLDKPFRPCPAAINKE